MRTLAVIARRELAAYFGAPLAYVFIVVFLAMSGALTFKVGYLLETGVAELGAFFRFHPWLYLFLMPAIGMRLWAEERKTGTIEFLMTLPVTPAEAVIGKFLAAWIFAGVALVLTVPVWITVNWLGDPDNGVIVASYLASWLLAGGFLALSACASAMTGNQVIAFVVGATLCFLAMMSGVDIVRTAFEGWAPGWVIDTVVSLSALNNFETISQGVIDARTLVYFVSLIVLGLVANCAVLEFRKP